MRLNSKQITILISPFVIAAITYTFSEDIVSNLHYLFPEYSSYQDKNLNKKASTYLKIEAKDKLYQQIRAKINRRHSNAKWVADNVLYKKETINIATDTKHRAWELQMVYPKKNIAIINNKIIKTNGIIDNAKLISIENSRVLIQHDERLEWLSLFK